MTIGALRGILMPQTRRFIVMERLEQFDKALIGKRIRAARKKHGLTQKKVCKEMGVPQSNISLYETGENTPSINFLITFSKTYGVSIDYLLGITDDDTSVDILCAIKENKVEVIESEEEISLHIVDADLRDKIKNR